MAKAAAYVRETQGIDLHVRPCFAEERLPAHLAHAYDFACGRILDLDCVLVFDTSRNMPSPASLEKHLARIQDVLGLPAVYVTASMVAHRRRRLVGRAIPFIVPFSQLYLPPLGLDFRERVRRRPVDPPSTFTPVTQAVLLHALLHGGDDEIHARAAAQALGYSEMSIGRAFRDLEAAKLATRVRRGRARPLRLAGSRHEIWHEAQPLLASPVARRWLTPGSSVPGALEAGLTALARVSMIAAPAGRTVAVSRDAWRALRGDVPSELVTDLSLADPEQVVVEVWAYAPEVLSPGPAVDLLSLVLSLRDERDERIEGALEEAMDKRPW